MSQLKLTLTRDPRVCGVKKTPIKQPLTVERSWTSPSETVVSQVSGAKLSDCIPKSSKSIALTQTVLFSEESSKVGSADKSLKYIATVPKLKPDLFKYTVTTVSIDSNQQQERVSSIIPDSLEPKDPPPPPLIKLTHDISPISKLADKNDPPSQTFKEEESIPLQSDINSSPSLSNIVQTLPVQCAEVEVAKEEEEEVAKEEEEEGEDISIPKPKKIKISKTLGLPLSRVKTIMKTNIHSPQNAPLLSQDSVHVVTKATELFISELVQGMEKRYATGNSRIEYNQLAQSVQDTNKLHFLQEILPKKVLARDYISSSETKIEMTL